MTHAREGPWPAQEGREGEAWPPAYQSDGPARPVDQKVA